MPITLKGVCVGLVFSISLRCMENSYLKVSKYLVAKCKPEIWLSRFWSIGIRIFLAGTIAIPIKPLEDLHHLFCCQWMALFIDTLFTTCYHMNHRILSMKIFEYLTFFHLIHNLLLFEMLNAVPPQAPCGTILLEATKLNQ